MGGLFVWIIGGDSVVSMLLCFLSCVIDTEPRDPKSIRIADPRRPRRSVARWILTTTGLKVSLTAILSKELGGPKLPVFTSGGHGILLLPGSRSAGTFLRVFGILTHGQLRGPVELSDFVWEMVETAFRGLRIGLSMRGL